jgi:hypothetical protein
MAQKQKQVVAAVNALSQTKPETAPVKSATDKAKDAAQAAELAYRAWTGNKSQREAVAEFCTVAKQRDTYSARMDQLVALIFPDAKSLTLAAWQAVSGHVQVVTGAKSYAYALLSKKFAAQCETLKVADPRATAGVGTGPNNAKKNHSPAIAMKKVTTAADRLYDVVMELAGECGTKVDAAMLSEVKNAAQSIRTAQDVCRKAAITASM